MSIIAALSIIFILDFSTIIDSDVFDSWNKALEEATSQVDVLQKACDELNQTIVRTYKSVFCRTFS